MTELGTLAEPIPCYEATIEQNGQTVVVVHTCADPNCPMK